MLWQIQPCNNYEILKIKIHSLPKWAPVIQIKYSNKKSQIILMYVFIWSFFLLKFENVKLLKMCLEQDPYSIAHTSQNTKCGVAKTFERNGF